MEIVIIIVVIILLVVLILAIIWFTQKDKPINPNLTYTVVNNSASTSLYVAQGCGTGPPNIGSGTCSLASVSGAENITSMGTSTVTITSNRWVKGAYVTAVPLNPNQNDFTQLVNNPDTYSTITISSAGIPAFS